MKCLYHANCNDGMAAALAVSLAHPGMPDDHFIPVQYGSPPPWEHIDDEDVIIVDFSYKRLTMMEIRVLVRSLVILDHHASAEKELAGLPYCFFDMDKSGAVMAWEYFHTAPVPRFFKYIQDRDLWRKEYPDADAVSFFLRSYPLTIDVWRDHYTLPISRMITEGRAIERWFGEQCKTLVKAWENAPSFSHIGGYKVPVINAPGFMGSELAGMLAEGYPFAAIFFHVQDGVVYSLRRRAGDVDLSVIASKYDGGGHPAAAGFKSETVLG